MNDKDKEAYEKYLIKNNVNQRQIWNELSLDEIWQAACEYKNSELKNAKKFSDIEVFLAKLTIENAKLREALTFYVDKYDSGYLAKIVLKELGDK